MALVLFILFTVFSAVMFIPAMIELFVEKNYPEIVWYEATFIIAAIIAAIFM